MAIGFFFCLEVLLALKQAPRSRPQISFRDSALLFLLLFVSLSQLNLVQVKGAKRGP